ncbi:YybH family protein [Marinibaculum pumilum]|uniref:YybH family protein n=1 Tax=Marinibaculum pumilum TaxID=1766165 RepID=A0ABV7L6P2_9PROT
MTASADETGLRERFEAWSNALNTGDLDGFWAMFDERCEILDEDYPWRMTKAEFIDHIDFHARGCGLGDGQGLWEFFQWIPREVNVLAIGDMGHVSGFSTFRGKPRDTGFRQRFMGFTLTWARIDGTWQLVCWHQSVLAGRIAGASPG